MNKTLLTAAALISALSLSPAAFAQSMIAGKAISDHDLPYVQSYCASLARKANTAAAANDQAPNADKTADNGGNNANPPADKAADAGQPDAADQPIDKTLVTSVDLDAITLDDCTKAGLVTTP